MQQDYSSCLYHLWPSALHDPALGNGLMVQSNTHSGNRNGLEPDLGIAAWPHAWGQVRNRRCVQPPGARLVP